MPTHQNTTDIVISGGGVPGLTLAMLLGGLGLKICVLEPHPPVAVKDIRPDGRTAALMAKSINILSSAGLWEDCAPYGAALKTLRIVEGETRVDFHCDDINLSCFGVNIPNNLQRAIFTERAAQSPNIRLVHDSLSAFKTDDLGVGVILSGGETLRARLLIGADGRQSKVREDSGIITWEREYGQSAITCLIDHSRPHDNISTEFHRPGGPFTIVPLPDTESGHRSSIVWVEYNNDAGQFMTMRRQDFEAALQQRSEDLVGKITLATPPQSWQLKAMRAKALTAPRIALIAEAAHVIHPLGAQGLNLSLRDVAALAEEIADAARRGEDIGGAGVLNRYRSRRHADIWTRVAGTHGLNRMVSNDLSLLRGLRSAGLKTISTLEPLRRFTMNEGVMPGYDDSRLARGEAL